MLDEKYENNNNFKWICCKNCKTWFHTHCVVLSNIEYEEIMKKNKNWFCPNSQCEEKKNINLEQSLESTIYIYNQAKMILTKNNLTFRSGYEFVNKIRL